jgi:hypothetical protein
LKIKVFFLIHKRGVLWFAPFSQCRGLEPRGLKDRSMTLPTPNAALPVGYHLDAPAENLLFCAYRCWMAGYATGDIACWDIAWEALAREMPQDNAKALFGEFHHFARTLRTMSGAQICWRPAACRALCRDECLILAMVAAAQRDDRVQLLTASFLSSGQRALASSAQCYDLARQGIGAYWPVHRPAQRRRPGGDDTDEAALGDGALTAKHWHLTRTGSVSLA